MRPIDIGLTLLVFAGVVSAQKCCLMHEEIEKQEPPPIEMMIDLSEQQKETIENIKFDTRKNVIPIKSQIELKRIELQKEMKSENPNKDRILKLSQEIHELEWQIKKLKIEERLKIHSILTPEQRAKMKMHKKKIIKKFEIEKEDD
ncbi:MAG: periplasmic heavy metal sensor [candidate division WOR-3 bacterium]|nr:periplasmic heavy metal sensor [candidate division WOR-3 bacterium]